MISVLNDTFLESCRRDHLSNNTLLCSGPAFILMRSTHVLVVDFMWDRLTAESDDCFQLLDSPLAACRQRRWHIQKGLGIDVEHAASSNSNTREETRKNEISTIMMNVPIIYVW